MSRNNQWDGILRQPLDLPFNRILPELDPTPRLVDGLNTYITLGGKLTKRPGTIAVDDTDSTYRADRFWVYSTIETPPKVYFVASVYNTSTGYWEIMYNRLDDGLGWTTLPALRNINLSTRPHEAAVARGLFYIKGFPASGASEKLGTVIFDGTDKTVTFWGLLGPTVAARITGIGTGDAMIKLTADASATDVTFNVNATASLPATPFAMRIEFEEVTVTAKTATQLTVTRGVNNTTAAAHKNKTPIFYLDWTASTNKVNIGIGQTYFYCWKTKTGHLSNLSPIEENPDKPPSKTPTFANKRPKIKVQGHADTVNVPTIVIFRSVDGGGNAFFLHEIANTGAGDITFEDKYLGSGAAGTTYEDPIPDTKLSANYLAPTQTSNSPPPAALAPAVTGVDPVEPSTPIAYYASRFWYGIGNVLFYSANEELNEGIPEEAFPSGTLGNTFRFQSLIVNLEATTEGLYVVTQNEVQLITGTNKETFNPQPVVQKIGGPPGHPRAITKYGEAVVFLTHDFRIAILQKKTFRALSDPLYTTLVDLINASTGAEVDIKYYADLEKEWIIVTVLRKDSPGETRQLVYDIKKSVQTKSDFWHTPWNIPAVAIASDRMDEDTNQQRLLFYLWQSDLLETALVTRLDSTVRTGSEATPDDATAPMDFFFTTNLMLVPEGNHVNTLRVPGVIPSVYNVRLELTSFSGDEDPRSYIYLDDIWTDPIELWPLKEQPGRIEQTKGYHTIVYPVNRVAARAALRITKNQSSELFEVQTFSVIFDPEFGGGF